ncbi:MAG: hypothetical protein WED09_04850 [Homoserinimonas sp.]
MINVHDEISDPDRPAYPVIVGQKRWMLGLSTDIAPAAQAPDPEGGARAIISPPIMDA